MKNTLLPLLVAVGLIGSVFSQSNEPETVAPIAAAPYSKEQLTSLLQSVYDDLGSADKEYNGHRLQAQIYIETFATGRKLNITKNANLKAESHQTNSDELINHAFETMQKMNSYFFSSKKKDGKTSLGHANDEIREALSIPQSTTLSPSTTPIKNNAPLGLTPSEKPGNQKLSEVTELLDSAYKILTGTKGELITSRPVCFHLQKFAQENGIQLTPSKTVINYGQNTGRFRWNDALTRIEQAYTLFPCNDLKTAKTLLRTSLENPINTF